MSPAGLEIGELTASAGNDLGKSPSGSAALGDAFSDADVHPDLATVIAAWPKLSDQTKRQVLALIAEEAAR